MTPIDVDDMRGGSKEAATLMRALSHGGRLLALCALCEKSHAVGDLEEVTGLGQSALSQHLAKLRGDGLVSTKRHGQTITYELANPAVREIIEVLHSHFCPSPGKIQEKD